MPRTGSHLLNLPRRHPGDRFAVAGNDEFLVDHLRQLGLRLVHVHHPDHWLPSIRSSALVRLVYLAGERTGNDPQ
jgi:hypothetical protein